jgi:hypothetical protein
MAYAITVLFIIGAAFIVFIEGEKELISKYRQGAKKQ